MGDRIEEEVKLLRKYYPNLEFNQDMKWILIHDYPLPENMSWNEKVIDVCFPIPQGYPGTNPYGIYVPANLQYDNQPPNNYQPSPNNKPPFPGNWGMLSWSPDAGQWKPTADLRTGSNLLNFVQSFATRFREGR